MSTSSASESINLSTNDAVFCLLDTLYRGRNAAHYSSVAYLDLSKALNCVNHHILIQKLQHYGVGTTCLKWFQSYLSNRYQYTVINEIKSNTAAVGAGVPQGSVLGPILYLIYVNDFGQTGIESFAIMFADDTALVQTHNSPKEAVNGVENDLCILATYFKKVKLKLDTAKTKIMHFHKNIRTKDFVNMFS